MSNIQRIEEIKQLVAKVEPDFTTLAKIHGAVHFKREASFALQILQENSFLSQIAANNPDSLKRAVINVAAIGLSLSPVHKLSYLVPRDGKVCLDISYRGYIQLAVEIGAIKWAIAEVVCEKDKYKFRGLEKAPQHEFDPFAERGKIIGAYCVAKTNDGEFIVVNMPIKDIYSIRDRSVSWKAFKKDGKTSPWNTDETEMIKKTVIRRAWKSWPMVSTKSERFERAVDATNEADPVEFIALPEPKNSESELNEKLENIRALLVEINRTEEAYLTHLARVTKREIKSLEDLTIGEADAQIISLNQMVESKKEKEKKNEELSTNQQPA